jgi:hypothetical protein
MDRVRVNYRMRRNHSDQSVPRHCGTGKYSRYASWHPRHGSAIVVAT